MSGVVRSAKKAVKSVGRFVKKNWKPIVSAAASSMGTWKAVGSTMWAGATSIAGTVGLGSGASGAAASAAGMQGATLLTGAGAQAMGLASAGSGAGAGLMGPPTAAGQASSAVGQYTGPGSGFLGGGGSLFGGGAEKAAAKSVAGMPSSNLSEKQVAEQMGGGSTGGGGSDLGRDLLVAATPSLIQGAGAYMAARGEEEARKPKAMWGVDMKTGEVAGGGGQSWDDYYANNHQPPNAQGGGLMDFNDWQNYAVNPYGQFGGQNA